MNTSSASQITLLDGRVIVDIDDLFTMSKAGDDDVVILSGTLLEGFGNSHSDLDLYVIGEELPVKVSHTQSRPTVREDGRLRRMNVGLGKTGGVLLDVQYYTFQELSTLSRSLRDLYEEARRGTAIYRKTLHHEDEDLIHKLLTGRVLRDRARRFDAQRTFDCGMFCFLKYRNEVGGYAEFRDLVGSWSSGDLGTCVYNIRRYLVAQVSGMMFLAGSTNVREKWFVRRLGALPDEHAEVREGVVEWLGRATLTERDKRAAVESACDLIDVTYRHARGLLATNNRYFSAEEALALTEHELAARSVGDKEAADELRLRRRMFSPVEYPLALEIRGSCRDSRHAAEGHANLV
jgi:hypothetical protein